MDTTTTMKEFTKDYLKHTESLKTTNAKSVDRRLHQFSLVGAICQGRAMKIKFS